jgi:hypothetical protein
MASDPTAITKLYEQIPLQAMQQVSDSYISWYVDRVTNELDKLTADLRSELRDNDAKEASYRPSQNELVAIERLQRSGVTGADLLDRMVEQGEDWLVLTMHRLDHFERTGLAPKDYSTWCEHALSGAYDWIDHERLGNAGSSNGAGAAARSGGGTPEWLSRGGKGSSQPEESPTAPVPSVAPRWSDSGYYGNGSGSGSGGERNAGRSGGGAGQGQADDSDGKGRNIFRIFTN